MPGRRHITDGWACPTPNFDAWNVRDLEMFARLTSVPGATKRARLRWPREPWEQPKCGIAVHPTLRQISKALGEYCSYRAEWLRSGSKEAKREAEEVYRSLPRRWQWRKIFEIHKAILPGKKLRKAVPRPHKRS